MACCKIFELQKVLIAVQGFEKVFLGFMLAW